MCIVVEYALVEKFFLKKKSSVVIEIFSALLAFTQDSV